MHLLLLLYAVGLLVLVGLRTDGFDQVLAATVIAALCILMILLLLLSLFHFNVFLQ